MSEGFVYKWTNTRNGKWYIGSHKGCVNDGYIGSGVIFQRAYKKYKDSFFRDIIYIGQNFREIEELILITLDAASDKMSYNIKNSSIGGDTSMNFTQESLRKMSEGSKKRDYSIPVSMETREKIRQSRLGTKLTDETKKKLSECRIGEKNHFYGKTHTEETKKKLSEANKGKKMSKESVERRAAKIRKQIYYQELDIVFSSLVDAGKHFGLHASTISNMLNGHIFNRFNLSFIDKTQQQ